MAFAPSKDGSGINVADVVAYAKSQIGKPYQWGASGPNAYDCSGLVQATYHKFGVDLPRTSQEQAKVGTPVPTSGIQAGDLVFSDWGDGPNSHVGIASNSGQIIDAPHTGALVRTDQLSAGYLSHVTAVRRITGTVGQGSVPAGPAPGGAGGADDPGIFGPILQPLTDLAHAASEVGKFADLLSKLALPTTFVRVTAGISGLMFIFLGVLLLSREVRR